jgi:hypothetical protein
MERFINEQEKKEKKQVKKKKKKEEKKPKVVKLKLKVPPRAPPRIPSPVDPWMVLSDDEVDNEEIEQDPYAADASELIIEEEDTKEVEEEEQFRRVLRTTHNQNTTTIESYARRVACVPSSRFDAGRLLADCSDVWTFVNNFSEMLQLQSFDLTFENFARMLSSPTPKAEITNLYVRLIDILLRDRDSKFEDSEPLWTIGPQQSIVARLTSAPDQCVKIDTDAMLRNNHRWAKPPLKFSTCLQCSRIPTHFHRHLTNSRTQVLKVKMDT